MIEYNSSERLAHNSHVFYHSASEKKWDYNYKAHSIILKMYMYARISNLGTTKNSQNEK